MISGYREYHNVTGSGGSGIFHCLGWGVGADFSQCGDCCICFFLGARTNNYVIAGF